MRLGTLFFNERVASDMMKTQSRMSDVQLQLASARRIDSANTGSPKPEAVCAAPRPHRRRSCGSSRSRDSVSAKSPAPRYW